MTTSSTDGPLRPIATLNPDQGTITVMFTRVTRVTAHTIVDLKGDRVPLILVRNEPVAIKALPSVELTMADVSASLETLSTPQGARVLIALLWLLSGIPSEELAAIDGLSPAAIDRIERWRESRFEDIA